MIIRSSLAPIPMSAKFRLYVNWMRNFDFNMRKPYFRAFSYTIKHGAK